jgi:tellurite resistance protein TerA
MELKQKGEDTTLEVTHPLTVSMRWTTAADFDLAVIYETNEGKQGIVYFGDKGQLHDFPYMALSKDEGIGDTGGNNEENMRIERLDDMKFIWIFCWDYGMVQKGQAARFKNSDVTLTIADDAGHQNTVTIDTGDSGNVCCIATIDKSDPAQAKFINYSQVGTLNGLKTLEQLTSIVQQFVI